MSAEGNEAVTLFQLKEVSLGGNSFLSDEDFLEYLNSTDTNIDNYKTISTSVNQTKMLLDLINEKLISLPHIGEYISLQTNPSVFSVYDNWDPDRFPNQYSHEYFYFAETENSNNTNPFQLKNSKLYCPFSCTLSISTQVNIKAINETLKLPYQYFSLRSVIEKDLTLYQKTEIFRNTEDMVSNNYRGTNYDISYNLKVPSNSTIYFELGGYVGSIYDFNAHFSFNTPVVFTIIS